MNLEEACRVIARYELMLSASQQQAVQLQQTIEQLTAQRDQLQESYDALANRDDDAG